jgi:hypothetical protein
MMYECFRRMIVLLIVIAFLTPVGVQSQDYGESSSPAKFSKEELAQMLAPVALYPDPLLSQMLIAASYPFEVVEAQRWQEKYPDLRGDALDTALTEKNWDVSILSLCHYQEVLMMMSDNLDWTARLGDAFVNRQQDVMDTIQELRAKANAQGNIATTKEQNVIMEEKTIRIEPAAPDVIYVPVYDPLIIYGPWWYPAYRPFSIYYPGVAVAGRRIVFSPRIFVSPGAFGWCGFNWRTHNIIIIDITRTARFNRQVNVYRQAQRLQWRPDRERRMERQRRQSEILRFAPPGRPVLRSPERRPAADVMPGRGEPHKEFVPQETQPVKGQRDKVEQNAAPTGRVEQRREARPGVERRGQETGNREREDVREGKGERDDRGLRPDRGGGRPERRQP